MKEAKHFLRVTTLILYATLISLTPAIVCAADRLNPGELLRAETEQQITSANVNTGSSCKGMEISFFMMMQNDNCYGNPKHRGKGSIESSCRKMAIWCSILAMASQHGGQVHSVNQDHFYWSRMTAIWSFTNLRLFGLRTLLDNDLR